MTKSQCRIFGKLRKKQVNANDVTVVEASDTCITFFVAFPGLYLTYDSHGRLLGVETNQEWLLAGKVPVVPGTQMVLDGEMGS